MKVPSIVLSATYALSHLHLLCAQDGQAEEVKQAPEQSQIVSEVRYSFSDHTIFVQELTPEAFPFIAPSAITPAQTSQAEYSPRPIFTSLMFLSAAKGSENPEAPYLFSLQPLDGSPSIQFWSVMNPIYVAHLDTINDVYNPGGTGIIFIGTAALPDPGSKNPAETTNEPNQTPAPPALNGKFALISTAASIAQQELIVSLHDAYTRNLATLRLAAEERERNQQLARLQPSPSSSNRKDITIQFRYLKPEEVTQGR